MEEEDEKGGQMGRRGIGRKKEGGPGEEEVGWERGRRKKEGGQGRRKSDGREGIGGKEKEEMERGGERGKT